MPEPGERNTPPMQNSLFEALESPDYCCVHTLGDDSIREYPYAFNGVESEYYLKKLISKIKWKQDYLRLAGKCIAVPRLQCWMGDPQAHYAYSGIQLQPEPWQELVLAIRARISGLTGHEFNSVLLNYYRDGRDSVAWHADDEKELGPEPVIASVSFGAERVFQLKHKHLSEAPRHRFKLHNGSILVMGKTIQNNWLHQIPKTKLKIGPRINLTFRTILPT